MKRKWFALVGTEILLEEEETQRKRGAMEGPVTFPWLSSPDLTSSPKSSPLCMEPCSVPGNMFELPQSTVLSPQVGRRCHRRKEITHWVCNLVLQDDGSLWPRFVCSAAQLQMKRTFLKFTVHCSPLKAPFPCLSLSTGDRVSSVGFTLHKGVSSAEGERVQGWGRGRKEEMD